MIIIRRNVFFRLQPCLLLAFLATFLLSACAQQKEDPKKWTYKDALLITGRNPHPCLTVDRPELELLTLAVSVIELENSAQSGWLDIGAQKLLGNGIYRKVDNDFHPVCLPHDLLLRTAAGLERRGGLGKSRLEEYQLALAAKLPYPSQTIVANVASSAFANIRQPSEFFPDEDIRPYARAVLASFGRLAADYAAMAYQQIEGDTPMGTGAAQVAAAGGHPEALQKVVALINSILKSIPPDRAIPRNARNRLYELAWAIVFSGEAGRPLVNEIYKIMDRGVESWAPPFGMVVINPKNLCKALEHLGDKDGLRRYAYCSDNTPYEQ